MLNIKSIYQIPKNAKKTSKIVFSLSILLWLTTIVDKIFLKGFVNYYLHTPVSYIIIFFLLLWFVRQEWENIQKAYINFKNSLERKDILKILIVIVPLILVILLKNKLNEYLIHQNILGVGYSWIKILLTLQFLAKSIILYLGALITSVLATILFNNSRKEKTDVKTNNNHIPISLVLILLFVIVKAYFIFKYQGNYQDDWYHIVAGTDFFKNGTFLSINQYFDGTGYIRGAYMSILTNFFMLIFGRSVNIAQLAPAFVGLINFIILLFLAKKALKKNIYILLFGLLYISNPFVILNQLYVRFYVFYELFFLLIILLLLALHTNLQTRSKIKAILILLALVILNILIWIYTGDKSAIIFPIYSVLGIAFCILDFPHVKIFLKRNFNQLLKNKWIFIPIALLLVSLFILFMKNSGLNLFLGIFKSSTSGGSNRNSLIHLICYTFAPLVLFTFLGFTQVSKKSISPKIIVLSAFLGLLIHLALPGTYQVIRGFGYLWGVLYLASFVFIEELIPYMKGLFKNKWIVVSILAFIFMLLSYSNFKSYSNDFISNGPNIVGEVAYYQFDATFKYIQTDLKNKILVESSYNVIPDMFYNEVPSYVLNLNHTLDNAYFPTQVKELTSIGQLQEVDAQNNVCVVMRDFSYDALVDQEFMTYLVNHYILVKDTIGYRIWCER